MPEYQLLNGVGYSTPAESRTYQPPSPPAQFEAPEVFAARAPKADGSTVLEQVIAGQLHAKKGFQEHLAETNAARAHYSTEGYKAQVAKFLATDSAKGVDQGVAQMRARRDQAQARIDKILSPSSVGDTAHELRNTRGWERAKGVLDAAKDGKYAAASTLIKNATREELAVLIEELPAYLTAHNQPTGWIQHEVAQVLPEYPSAKAQLDKATAALQIVETNANFLRRGFEEGRAPAVMVDPFKPRFPGENPNKYDPDA